MSQHVGPSTGPKQDLPGSRNAERLRALARYSITDTASEAAFDQLARLAAQICNTPIGLITFVDDVRQFFKARIGFDGDIVAPLENGFCPIVVRDEATLIISDTRASPLYAGNLAVTMGGVRFYAGVPLITPDGHALGTLCVLDQEPHDLTPEQQLGLHELANQVIGQLELRRLLRLANEQSERAEHEAADVIRQAYRLERLGHASAQMMLASNSGELVGDLYANVAAVFHLDVCFNYGWSDGVLSLVASAGLTLDQTALAARLVFEQTICGMVVASREASHITDIKNGDHPQAAFLKVLGVDTYICIPMLAGDEVLGTLAFGRKAGAFSSDELHVLRLLASYAAMAHQRLGIARALASTSIRRAFLVEFGDRLRDIADSRAIMLAATKLLGQHLLTDRVGYAEIDEAGDHAIIDRDWVDDHLSTFAGRHRLDDFGPALIAALRLGRTVRLNDILSEPLTAGEMVASAYVAASMRAAINVPLVKSGCFVAVLYVHSREPRQWTDEEVALVQEVAERTWAAVARARAEAGLRHANETLEQQVSERTAALLANEARLRTIFETSYQFQGLIALDGTLLDANATSLAAIDSTLEDVVGKHFSDTPWFTGTPGMSEEIRAALLAVAHGEAVRREILVKVSAGWRSFDFALRPIRDESGAIIAIAPEALETTGRRQVEEELRQSQKMEALGQLTGGIAHDFNNLLQGIVGSLDLIQLRIIHGRTGELGSLISGAMTSAERAAALTHRLLAFSRRQPLDPKPVSANSLTSSLEDLLRRTIGEKIQLKFVLAADLWITLCDPNQLENAILNLVINARDAMPSGGFLTITTCNVPGLGPDDYVCIDITDTGVGMSPETIKSAFDPFFTTKPIGQGTGLGLSMIYGFARQSGGYCNIQSDVGRGTSVKLYLRRHYGETAESELLSNVVNEQETKSTEKGEVVLVVEDEPLVRMLVVEVLLDLGYRALEATDGTSGLAILRSGERIDLLITDVGLPHLNGRQMADAARERRPRLKVLFMTGYAENNVLASSSLEPGMEIITKPFTLPALATRIRGIIEGDGIS